MIHGPSLAIGAVIASVAIIIAFLGFDGISNEVELVIEPAPTIQELGPTIISMETYLANGSPVLGDPNAPITLVEF
ncbi:MAG: protein-disulfide isomerase, partial [Nitrosopumilus sp.]